MCLYLCHRSRNWKQRKCCCYCASFYGYWSLILVTGDDCTNNFSWTLWCIHKNRGKKCNGCMALPFLMPLVTQRSSPLGRSVAWRVTTLITAAKETRGAGVLLGILGGDVPRGSPNLDPFSDQNNVIFHTRFQTWPLNSIPILRPGLYEIMSSSLRLEQQQQVIY